MTARLLGALLAGLLGMLAPLALGTAPATAHSNEVGTSPEDGAQLDAAPATVQVSFDSPLLDMGAALVVRDANGTSATVGAPRLERQRITVDLAPTAGPGEYTVAYRVVAEDGHTLEGSFGFTVAGEVASPTASSVASPTASPVSAAAAVPAAAESPSAGAEQDSGPPYLLLGLGALAIVLVAAGALALRR